MNKTKIVCTIGPSCSDVETIKEMILAGMDVARFNMSHGNYESHRKLMNNVKKAREELGVPVAIMLDTKGPEVRIKQFKNGKVFLETGKTFALTTENVVGDSTIVSVTYQKLPNVVVVGTKILLNDGLIELSVTGKTDKIIYTKVVVGGELSNNKSINIPSVDFNMEYLSETDKADLAFGVKEGVDIFSISFVNSADDVKDVRDYLAYLGETNAFIISKIESAKGVSNMNKIIEASDGIMVARGDMGVEIEFEKLPHIQKELIMKCRAKGKTSIIATQMLESMINNSRPTRAEISDVANAIYDGTSAIMLSGETSAGKHPVLVVKTMNKIANEAESVMDYKNQLEKFVPTSDVTCAVGYAACALASSLNAKAILVATKSGASAVDICRFRPESNIIALTPNEKTLYKLSILWGVLPVMQKVYDNNDEMLSSARDIAVDLGYVKKGDLVVQTAGELTKTRGSNTLVVSKIL